MNQKAISPVVATALLLVVAVVAIVGFQGWFQTYSSALFNQAESQDVSLDASALNTIKGDTLYFDNKLDENVSIRRVSIAENDCQISQNVSSGLESISLNDCADNISGPAEVVIETDKGVVAKDLYFPRPGSGTSSLSCTNNTPEGFHGGSGTKADPWEICDCMMLQNVSGHLNSHFELVNDIDCSATASWNGGLGFEPLGDFANDFGGSFDGNNYTISDLTINRPGAQSYPVALFGEATLASFDDMEMTSASIEGNAYVGMLVGNIQGGVNITDSSFQGSVIGHNYTVGGLVGYMGFANRIMNTDVDVSVEGTREVGGLAGYAEPYLWVKETAVTGSVNGTQNSIGGFIGEAWDELVINDSYARVDVEGNDSVGGFIGHFMHNPDIISINRSYSAGNVTGNSDVGGFIGSASTTPNVETSYWDVNASGQATSVEGTGKTTSEMYQQATYTGWDFSNVWQIDEGNDYPDLR